MEVNEFFDQCNSSLAKSQDTESSMQTMVTFGDEKICELTEDTVQKSAEDKGIITDDVDGDDFADDFSDDFAEPFMQEVVTTESNDFADDFADDFENGTKDDECKEINIQPANVMKDEKVTLSDGIKSVQMCQDTVNDDWTIEGEITQFLNDHSSEKLAGALPTQWNSVYNDNLVTDDQVIEKYLNIHYGLWFQNITALQAAISLGKNFLDKLEFEYRVCTESDIALISDVYSMPWYDSNIINLFALNTSYVAQLIQLMQQGKINKEQLYKYRSIPDALACYLRLFSVDKFILGEFNNAIDRGNIIAYTEATLNGTSDRFAAISHRKDFAEIKEVIFNIENNGGLIQLSTLEKYRDAAHLDSILWGQFRGVYNEEFIDKYLVQNLNQFKFIADIYANGDVNVTLAPTNFMLAKLLTDATKFSLKMPDLTAYANERALSCLICSRYCNKLSEVDYKRFLAVLSMTDANWVINSLNNEQHLIESYNAFWCKRLAFILDIGCIIDQGIGDNIVFVKNVSGKFRKYYLQIDDFVLEPNKFLELVKPTEFITCMKNNGGLLLSTDILPVMHVHSYSATGSITTWAMDNISQKLIEQFKQYDVVRHANFLRALDAADTRLRNQDGNTSKISSSVLEFLKLPDYLMYDKTFGYIAERPEFLGLFTSKHAFMLLKLFSNTCIYDSVPKIMFMFLYVVFLKFCGDKLHADGKNFSKLNPTKSVVLIDINRSNNSCINFRTVSDSIDNFIVLAQKSKSVILKVSIDAINVQFISN